MIDSISLFENASKISHFCLDSFSLVSTNFWILSSISVSPRSNLAAKPEKFRKFKKFSIENFDPKPEKCNFAEIFLLEKKLPKLPKN